MGTSRKHSASGKPAWDLSSGETIERTIQIIQKSLWLPLELQKEEGVNTGLAEEEGGAKDKEEEAGSSRQRKGNPWDETNAKFASGRGTEDMNAPHWGKRTRKASDKW